MSNFSSFFYPLSVTNNGSQPFNVVISNDPNGATTTSLLASSVYWNNVYSLYNNATANSTFTTSVSSPSISAITFYGDGSKLSNITTSIVSSVQLPNGSYNLTLPTNASDGTRAIYRFYQPQIGTPCTVNIPANVRFPSSAGISLPFSTSTGLIDVLGLMYNANSNGFESTAHWDVISFVPGYTQS